MRVTSAPAPSPIEPWRTRLAASLLGSTAAWAVLLWWAPYALGGGAVHGVAQAFPLAAYVAGHAVCHQRQERSFAVRGIRQPVCARCAGLYAGAPMGLATALALRTRARRRRMPGIPHRVARRVVVWAALPTLMAIVIESLQMVPVGNATRFALAIAPGGAGGWVTAAALLGQVGERVEYTTAAP